VRRPASTPAPPVRAPARPTPSTPATARPTPAPRPAPEHSPAAPRATPAAAAAPALSVISPVLFRRSGSGHRSPNGILVKVLQAALKQANLYASAIDGDYGPGTEAGVKALQQASGRAGDGICRDVDWEKVTGLPAPSLFDRCLQLTAAFEGTGFEKAVGNFDGAYLTWGIIGYTLKHDLPLFLAKVEREYPGTLARAFGSRESELRQVLAASDTEKQRWANAISEGSNRYGLRADWKADFAKLGLFPEVQDLQIKDARERYWATCLRDARRWRAADAIDIALFFDTAVQNGGAGRDSIAGPLDALAASAPDATGVARRRRWAEIIAAGSSLAARQDVLSRRSTIANGYGTVHGETYVLSEWGVEPRAVDLDRLADDHSTFIPASYKPSAPQPVAVREPTPAPVPVSAVPPPASATPPAIPAADLPTPAPAVGIDLDRDFKACVARALAHIDRDRLDRNWGPPAPEPCAVLLETRSRDLPGGWREWPDSRQAVALIQVIAKLKSLDPGVIDGFWGQVTQYAFDGLVHLRDRGAPLPNWRDEEPIEANPHRWPSQAQDSLTAFYGPPCQVRQVKVRCPWTLRLAWDLDTTFTSISCHEKVAASLSAVLEAVYAHYGAAELKRLRLDRFGGCYNCRPMRGASRPSTHAWAIALDWDPDLNQLQWGRDRATLARPEYQAWWSIWEREGWLSLGRSKNYDWMHVQAAKL
jgi:peptidoglycan hydrolase-like protein with peptidoglycan-binding domain